MNLLEKKKKKKPLLLTTSVPPIECDCLVGKYPCPIPSDEKAKGCVSEHIILVNSNYEKVNKMCIHWIKTYRSRSIPFHSRTSHLPKTTNERKRGSSWTNGRGLSDITTRKTSDTTSAFLSMSGFAIHVGYRRKIDKLCMALSRVILSFFLDISLLTIFIYRIYSYTPVDVRYFPKGGCGWSHWLL